VGFDSKRPIGARETGGRVSAPIWKTFMEQALAGLPPAQFPIPDGLKCVNVDPATGARAATGTAGRLECFRPGTEPQPGAMPVQVVQTGESGEPSSLDFMRSDF
jgi:penicillin-binding protein 1A